MPIFSAGVVFPNSPKPMGKNSSTPRMLCVRYVVSAIFPTPDSGLSHFSQKFFVNSNVIPEIYITVMLALKKSINIMKGYCAHDDF